MSRIQVGTEGPRVLVIDDEPRLCAFLSDRLSLMGCRVTAAHTGEAGIAQLSEHDFDVVLCDIMMPGNGGIWTLETIKEHRPSTEVIMITGYATQESAEVCKALGAFNFMTKPFELDDVRAEIEKAFQKRTSVRTQELTILPNPAEPERELVMAGEQASMAEGTAEDVLARIELAMP